MDAPKLRPDPLFPHGTPPRFLIDAGAYPNPDPLWPPGEGWRVQDGLILLPPLVSDVFTGEEWIARLEAKGIGVLDKAKRVLRSPGFRPTAGATNRIAILPGSLFPDRGRTTELVRVNAVGRGLSAPPAEAACLIRETLSNADMEEMGLQWIVAMHDPIEGGGTGSYLLRAYRGNGCRWLTVYYGDFGVTWGSSVGFAFVLESAR